MEGDGPRARLVRTTRLEAFSDGVFAIAVTLLVLDIAVPVGSEEHPLQSVLDQWPAYLTYVVSFATIGAVWLGHTGITEYLDSADSILMRLNLLLLLVVSFLPFPTRLLGEFIRQEHAERVAVTVYGITLMATFLALWVVWRYARHAGLIREEVDSADLQSLDRRLTPGLAGYAVMIALGLFAPVPAVVGYLVVAVLLIVPVGTVLRRGASKRRRDPRR